MEFRRRLKPVATVDLVPMIDVVFQLVLFFMLSSTFILTPGISLVLPESSTAEPVAMTRMVITVVSREEVYLNKDRYTLEGLDNLLKGVRLEEKDTPGSIIIEGDSSASYSLLVEVLDILRRNNYKGVNLRMREAPEE